MRSAHRIIVLYSCGKSFQNETNPLRVIERTRNSSHVMFKLEL